MSTSADNPPAIPHRNTSLDYLRCLCTAIIICIHMTGLSIEKLNLQSGSAESVLFALLCLILALGVPPFFMLSGAFMIKKEIPSLTQFYCRSYGRILPWSIFFFIVGSIFEILNTWYNDGTKIWETGLADFYSDWFTRGGTGVLWFIPALMGLYLITPLLVWIRQHTTLLQFSILTAIVFAATEYLLIPYLYADYASYPINWFKGIFFIGHYMLGYCGYTICQQCKHRFFNASTTGVLFFIAISGCAVWLSPQYAGEPVERINISAQSIIAVGLSTLLFIFFNKLPLPSSRLISTISTASIVIYLSHNYLPLPIIRFAMKWTGLWNTLFRDSFIFQFICYGIAIAFSFAFGILLQHTTRFLYTHIRMLITQPRN